MEDVIRVKTQWDDSYYVAENLYIYKCVEEKGCTRNMKRNKVNGEERYPIHAIRVPAYKNHILRLVSMLSFIVNLFL